ncbi:MAG TPA: type 1 glutamine amidotransferase [Casimicrobiaceae bacterium]|nr:type 1 glutamine amidotransferase [Casimicrobiaceae bacterium]
MQPVAVFRFSPTEGPAHFAEWLDAHHVPWRLIAVDRGERVPTDPRQFSGIGMMGGPMSVNDALGWIPQIGELLRAAVANRVPVLGHCLGGQLLAQALGANVQRTPTPEIGWLDVEVTAPAAATQWFGGRERFTVFQWHYDAFELPASATRVLANAFNPNQAYVIDEVHIGFQCHIEMTRDLVDTWLRTGADELPAQSLPARQSRAEILHEIDRRLADLGALADGVYARWAQNLRR